MGLVYRNPPDLIGNCFTLTQPHGRKFFILACLCRELQKGWLETIRFVTPTVRHGMEPMIFWGPYGPGAWVFKLTS
jgi:hypothetical protein